MASSYPGALDSLTNPVGTDALTSPAHASQHANVNDAIEAIEATLGVNPQGAYATVKDRLAVVDLAAGSAAASASAAAVSAASAAGAAVDAGAAANSAVTAYDNFDDRYLGAKSSAPTVDNDGNALLTGALYWNSTSSQMFAYTGTAWTTLANVAQAIEANSSSAALRITQTGAGNALLVEDSANPDATPFVVDASGVVVVGHTTDLDAYRLQVNTTDGAAMSVARYNAASTGPVSRFIKSRNASIGGNTTVQSGDTLGTLAWHGADGTGLIRAAAVTGEVDGTPGTNDMPGRLVFSTTADGASTVTERMRITSAGNVGIGTSSPDSRLVVFDATTSRVQIQGDATTDLWMRRASTNASGNRIFLDKARGTIASPSIVADADNLGEIRWRGHDGTDWRNTAIIQAEVDGTPGSGDMPGRLTFWTTPDGTTTITERMRINNAGLITGTGTSLGAWTAYTPTLGGTGWAIGNGTAAGLYCQIGKTVHFRATIVFGSTSTFGSVPLTVSLPLTRSSSEAVFAHVATDASAGARYPGVARSNATTTATPINASTNQAYISTNPFTWATSDELVINGTYEIA